MTSALTSSVAGVAAPQRADTIRVREPNAKTLPSAGAAVPQTGDTHPITATSEESPRDHGKPAPTTGDKNLPPQSNRETFHAAEGWPGSPGRESWRGASAESPRGGLAIPPVGCIRGVPLHQAANPRRSLAEPLMYSAGQMPHEAALGIESTATSSGGV